MRELSESTEPTGPTGRIADAALATSSLVGIGCLGYALADSWGGGYWMYSCGVAVVMTAFALLRRHQRTVVAIAGMVATTAAVLTSAATSLPAEPNPVTALAFAVLLGSAVRQSAPWHAATMALAGAIVAVVTWVAVGAGTHAFLIVIAWSVAIVVGLSLRSAGSRVRELVA
jgi:hypothetical protein